MYQIVYTLVFLGIPTMGKTEANLASIVAGTLIGVVAVCALIIVGGGVYLKIKVCAKGNRISSDSP